MSKYTPTTKEVRKAFTYAASGWHRAVSTAKAGFNRWLKSIKYDAWEKGYAAGDHDALTKNRLNTTNPYADKDTK